MPLTGSAFAFLVDPAALELRRVGSGLDLEACMQPLGSIGKLAESHIG